MNSKTIMIAGGLTLAAATWMLMGCASTGTHSAMAAQTPDGSKLWAQNCNRCHNSRSPTSYSQAQWEVVMLHMRVRANLTAREHQAILEFIKAAD